MANSYFQFKQFKIEQADCAMKVCTDACILGAWFASRANGYQHILDIGSGTGLLMMMLAQQSPAKIHGIEIEPACHSQLTKNTLQNEWSQRMEAFAGDVRTYRFPVSYDFIITNPPFYEKDLASPAAGKQLAMHSAALNLEELAESVAKNLSPGGSLGIMLPYHRTNDFAVVAKKHGLYLVETLRVRQTPLHNWFRLIATYQSGRIHEVRAGDHGMNNGNEAGAPAIEEVKTAELTIRDSEGQYTPAFVGLLRDYYLNLA
jgi:tRNA1Val (adenine37-N6)-methyltransferase